MAIVTGCHFPGLSRFACAQADCPVCLEALILLPFMAVYVLSETRVFDLTTNNLLIMAAILAAVDVVVFFLAKATFRREEILTKWK